MLPMGAPPPDAGFEQARVFLRAGRVKCLTADDDPDTRPRPQPAQLVPVADMLQVYLISAAAATEKAKREEAANAKRLRGCDSCILLLIWRANVSLHCSLCFVSVCTDRAAAERDAARARTTMQSSAMRNSVTMKSQMMTMTNRMAIEMNPQCARWRGARKARRRRQPRKSTIGDNQAVFGVSFYISLCLNAARCVQGWLSTPPRIE